MKSGHSLIFRTDRKHSHRHSEDAKTHPRYWGARLIDTDRACRSLSSLSLYVRAEGQNCYGGDMGRKAPIVVRKQQLCSA